MKTSYLSIALAGASLALAGCATHPSRTVILPPLPNSIVVPVSPAIASDNLYDGLQQCLRPSYLDKTSSGDDITFFNIATNGGSPFTASGLEVSGNRNQSTIQIINGFSSNLTLSALRNWAVRGAACKEPKA
jgi:hypothetical protein